MTTKEFAKILQDKLTSEYGVELNVASQQQIYRALALICRQMMSENHKKFQVTLYEFSINMFVVITHAGVMPRTDIPSLLYNLLCGVNDFGNL